MVELANMKKKMRKFAEGGELDFETKQGKNEAISDETREKARKFVEDKEDKEESIKPKATSKASTPTVKASKAETKSESKAETAEENKERMEGLTKKQALEKVEPENYIPGPGMLKGMFKNAVRAGEKEVARTVTTKAGKDIPVKHSKPDFSGEAKEGMGVKSVKNKSGKEIPVTKMKSGGSVGSASKRADGCAVKGKTKGKMV
jgi:hypothetical protein